MLLKAQICLCKFKVKKSKDAFWKSKDPFRKVKRSLPQGQKISSQRQKTPSRVQRYISYFMHAFSRSEMSFQGQKYLSTVRDTFLKSKDPFRKVKRSLPQGQKIPSARSKIPLQGQNMSFQGQIYLSNFMHAFPRSFMLLNSQICLSKVRNTFPLS